MNAIQILELTNLALALTDRLVLMLKTMDDAPIEITEIGNDLAAARDRLQRMLDERGGDE